MRIAIHQNHEIFNHSTLWNKTWIEYCAANNLDYDVVNCFDTDILDTLKNYDVLLWHFSHYSHQEMQFARSILNGAKNLGLKVFPDYNTVWHFDDKVAETYLLKSINAPIPKSWTFFTKKSAMNFFENECEYPVVAKLRCGSGSSNVKLLKNKSKAGAYVSKMFKKGFKSAPSILYKTKSNIKSSRDWETFIKRFKRIPDFIESLRNAKKMPNEKGYVFIQEFVPNDGYDLKVTVVGNKLSFLVRDVRKGDFRASGGGTIKYDKTFITDEIRAIAFDLSDKLGFQSMGYDFVVDKRDHSGKIVEISYGFSHTAQMNLNGYWDRAGVWHDEPMNAPVEVLKNIISET